MKNWMEKNLGRRLLAMVLCLSMVLSMAPVPSFAEGCTHHPEHTAECGYVAAVQGQPCGHTHTDACYTFQTVCLHSDHGECGYVAAVEEVSCACQPNENGEMVHTEGCGYVPAVVGVPCGHVCSVESGCVTATSPITLEGNMDATHIIEATDKAGTTTTYTVYMKTLADKEGTVGFALSATLLQTPAVYGDDSGGSSGSGNDVWTPPVL